MKKPITKTDIENAIKKLKEVDEQKKMKQEYKKIVFKIKHPLLSKIFYREQTKGDGMKW